MSSDEEEEDAASAAAASTGTGTDTDTGKGPAMQRLRRQRQRQPKPRPRPPPRTTKTTGSDGAGTTDTHPPPTATTTIGDYDPHPAPPHHERRPAARLRRSRPTTAGCGERSSSAPSSPFTKVDLIGGPVSFVSFPPPPDDVSDAGTDSSAASSSSSGRRCLRCLVGHGPWIKSYSVPITGEEEKEGRGEGQCDDEGDFECDEGGLVGDRRGGCTGSISGGGGAGEEFLSYRHLPFHDDHDYYEPETETGFQGDDCELDGENGGDGDLGGMDRDHFIRGGGGGGGGVVHGMSRCYTYRPPPLRPRPSSDEFFTEGRRTTQVVGEGRRDENKGGGEEVEEEEQCEDDHHHPLTTTTTTVTVFWAVFGNRRLAVVSGGLTSPFVHHRMVLPSPSPAPPTQPQSSGGTYEWKDLPPRPNVDVGNDDCLAGGGTTDDDDDAAETTTNDAAADGDEGSNDVGPLGSRKRRSLIIRRYLTMSDFIWDVRILRVDLNMGGFGDDVNMKTVPSTAEDDVTEAEAEDDQDGKQRRGRGPVVNLLLAVAMAHARVEIWCLRSYEQPLSSSSRDHPLCFIPTRLAEVRCDGGSRCVATSMCMYGWRPHEELGWWRGRRRRGRRRRSRETVEASGDGPGDAAPGEGDEEEVNEDEAVVHGLDLAVACGTSLREILVWKAIDDDDDGELDDREGRAGGDGPKTGAPSTAAITATGEIGEDDGYDTHRFRDELLGRMSQCSSATMGKTIVVRRPVTQRLLGHEGVVHRVKWWNHDDDHIVEPPPLPSSSSSSFLPTHLASTSDDRTVRLWRLVVPQSTKTDTTATKTRSGYYVNVWTGYGHTSRVWDVEFLPPPLGGRAAPISHLGTTTTTTTSAELRLLSSGEDGTVRLWTFDHDDGADDDTTAVSHDGVVVGGSHDGGALSLWRLAVTTSSSSSSSTSSSSPYTAPADAGGDDIGIGTGTGTGITFGVGGNDGCVKLHDLGERLWTTAAGTVKGVGGSDRSSSSTPSPSSVYTLSVPDDVDGYLVVGGGLARKRGEASVAFGGGGESPPPLSSTIGGGREVNGDGGGCDGGGEVGTEGTNVKGGTDGIIPGPPDPAGDPSGDNGRGREHETLDESVPDGVGGGGDETKERGGEERGGRRKKKNSKSAKPPKPPASICSVRVLNGPSRCGGHCSRDRDDPTILVSTRGGQLHSYNIREGLWVRLRPWWPSSPSPPPRSPGCTLPSRSHGGGECHWCRHSNGLKGGAGSIPLGASCMDVHPDGRVVAVGTSTGHVTLAPIVVPEAGEVSAKVDGECEASSTTCCVRCGRELDGVAVVVKVPPGVNSAIQGVRWLGHHSTNATTANILVVFHIRGVLTVWDFSGVVPLLHEGGQTTSSEGLSCDDDHGRGWGWGYQYLRHVVGMHTVGVPLCIAHAVCGGGRGILFVGDSRGNIGAFDLAGEGRGGDNHRGRSTPPPADAGGDPPTEVLLPVPPAILMRNAHGREHVTSLVVSGEGNSWRLLSVGHDGCLLECSVLVADGGNDDSSSPISAVVEMHQQISRPLPQFSSLTHVWASAQPPRRCHSHPSSANYDDGLIVAGYRGNAFVAWDISGGFQLLRVDTGGRQRRHEFFLDHRRASVGASVQHVLVVVTDSGKVGGSGGELLMHASRDLVGISSEPEWHDDAGPRMPRITASDDHDTAAVRRRRSRSQSSPRCFPGNVNLGTSLHGETTTSVCWCQSEVPGMAFLLSGSNDCSVRLSLFDTTEGGNGPGLGRPRLHHTRTLLPHESCVRAVCCSGGSRHPGGITVGGRTTSSPSSSSHLLVTCGGKLGMNFYLLWEWTNNATTNDAQSRFSVSLLCSHRPRKNKATIDHRMNAVVAYPISTVDGTSYHLVVGGDSDGLLHLFAISEDDTGRRSGHVQSHLLSSSSSDDASASRRRPILCIDIVELSTHTLEHEEQLFLLVVGDTAGDVHVWCVSSASCVVPPGDGEDRCSGGGAQWEGGCCATGTFRDLPSRPLCVYEAHRMGTNCVSAAILSSKVFPSTSTAATTTVPSSVSADNHTTVERTRGTTATTRYEILVCTGGDDQALAVAIMNVFVTTPTDHGLSGNVIERVHVGQMDVRRIPNVSSSAVRSVKTMAPSGTRKKCYHLYAVGYDQRLSVWSISLAGGDDGCSGSKVGDDGNDDDSGKTIPTCKFRSLTSVDVFDVSCFDVIEARLPGDGDGNDDGIIEMGVCGGEGIEIFSIDRGEICGDNQQDDEDCSLALYY